MAPRIEISKLIVNFLSLERIFETCATFRPLSTDLDHPSMIKTCRSRSKRRTHTKIHSKVSKFTINDEICQIFPWPQQKYGMSQTGLKFGSCPGFMLFVIVNCPILYISGPYAGFSEGGFEMERKVTKH